MKYEFNVARAMPALLIFVALTLGFAVADLTNVRWLGGLVMMGIGAYALFLMNRIAGAPRTLIGVVVVVGGFIVSHALGPVLGSYGALFLVASVCAVVIFLITGRKRLTRS